MSDTLTETEKANAVQGATDKGLPPGVTEKDVPADQVSKLAGDGIPKAPNEPSNKAPAKEQTAEEKAAAEAKAKEAEAQEENKDKQTDDKAEFVSYGHAAADAAVNLLKESGVTPQEAEVWFAKVKETNNIDDLNFAEMEKKLGKDKANLVASAAKDYYNSAKATESGKSQAVLDEVGGDANYALVRDWALKKEKSDPKFAEQLNQFRKMIDLGTSSAKLAGKALKEAYEGDPSNKSLGTKMVQGTGVPSRDATTGTLTRNEYLAQVKVAQEKGDHAEIARLRSVRAASRG